MNLAEKAAARRARIAAHVKRDESAHVLRRRPDLPLRDTPRFRVGSVTFNRQVTDERGKTTRQPPRRTPR